MVELMREDWVLAALMSLCLAFMVMGIWDIIDQYRDRTRLCWKCKRSFLEDRNEQIAKWKHRHHGERLPESLRFTWYQDELTHEYVITGDDRREENPPPAAE